MEREDRRGRAGQQVSVFESAFHGDPTAISYSDPNTHRFNHYADKQLHHLVIAEEFDFPKIASMLSTSPATQTTSSATNAVASPSRAAGRGGPRFTLCSSVSLCFFSHILWISL